MIRSVQSALRLDLNGSISKGSDVPRAFPRDDARSRHRGVAPAQSVAGQGHQQRPLNILMLLSDGFGGFGGIAKFNRDFLTALDSCDVVGRVHALPRLIPGPIDERIPEVVVYDRRAAAGKRAFIMRLASHLATRERPNLVVCGHLNLLPAAWIYARARGARLALIVHGFEARTPRRWARL